MISEVIMLDFLKRFKKAKTFKELFNIMTWKDIDVLAAIPVFLFMISPVIFYWQITFIKTWRYEITVSSLRMVTVVFAIIVMTSELAKQYLSGSSLKKIIEDHIPHMLFLIMSVLVLVSTFINGFTVEAMSGDHYRNESSFAFISYFLCFFGCASAIRFERTKKILLNSFLISGSFTSITALLDLSGIISIWHFHVDQKPDTLTSVFYHYNHFGYFLAIAVTISFALCLSEKKVIPRILYFLSLALHTVTLIINNTRGCYLACLGAMIVTFIVFAKTGKIKLKTFLPALAVLIVAVVTGFLADPGNLRRFMILFRDVSDISSSAVSGNAGEISGNAGSGRMLLWRLTCGAIVQKPVFGWGTDGIRVMLALNSIDGNNRPHNEFLQYAAFYGIPAALIYVSALVSIYFRACRRLSKLPAVAVAALLAGVAYLISSCFGNTMFYTAPFLFILLGLGFRTEDKECS